MFTAYLVLVRVSLNHSRSILKKNLRSFTGILIAVTSANKLFSLGCMLPNVYTETTQLVWCYLCTLISEHLYVLFSQPSCRDSLLTGFHLQQS